MEPQRYLRCLGQPILFAPTGEPIRFRTRKHLALLVYIAVEARSHRRDRLAELLWPKVSASEARHSLATALSTLRPRLGLEGLETTRDHVRLTPGRVALDLERLQSGDVLGTEVTRPLEVAAFLDGFDIPDSAEFTHWKDRQQARLLPIIKDALLVLIDRCRRTGDTRQIEQLADRMLALDELSEEAIRAKMEARAFAGDRLTALEIFEAWKKKLFEELQAVPSDLVEGMAVRLRRRGWERTTLANIPNVPTDQWRGRPFIGRTAEYQVLYERWEAARKGIPGHVLVLGDSGVGKTTLVQRLTTAAGLEGAAISRVQCYDLEREIPYSTLSGLLLGLLDRPGVSATSPEALAELSRTVPEVRHRFPNIPNPSDSQGETARIRLTEASLEMLTAIGEEHPVILVIDDLHLADDVSLAVLHLIIRRARGQPIMLVLIARPGELAQSSQAVRLRESAAPLDIRELELLPLSKEESGDLLESLVASDEAQPGAPERRTLIRAGAGFPMVLELLVQDWKVSREASLALSIDAMTENLGSGGSAQSAYLQILARITRSLESTTHNVLNLAAILGPHLNDVGMYAIADLSAGQTMTAMADLVSRRVLRDGPQGLEFVNELVRAAVYLGVPPTIRRVLHSHIADRFIQQRASSHGDLELEIAWHCMRAGRGAESTPYLLRGARQAIRSGAPHEAQRGLVTALPNLAKSAKAEALILLAEAAQEEGRWLDLLTYLEQIDESCHSQSSDLAFVLRVTARRRLGLYDSEELTELPERLLEFVCSKADAAIRIRAAIEAASVLNASHSTRLTHSLLHALQSFSSANLDVIDQANLLLARSMLFYNIREFPLSLACNSEARQLLEKGRYRNSLLATLQNGVGAILSAQGRYRESLPFLTSSCETAFHIGNDRFYPQGAANLSLCYSRLGDYPKALQWAERAWSSHGLDFGFIIQASQSAVLAYAMTTQAEKAKQLIRNGLGDLNRLGSPGLSQAWDLYSADALLILRNYEEAHLIGWRATTGSNECLHMDFCVGPYARWIAILGSIGTDPLRARERINRLLSNASHYDALDQAEIRNASVWLDWRLGNIESGDYDKLISQIADLPSAVTEQLRRMGMLDFMEGTNRTMPYASRELHLAN